MTSRSRGCKRRRLRNVIAPIPSDADGLHSPHTECALLECGAAWLILGLDRPVGVVEQKLDIFPLCEQLSLCVGKAPRLRQRFFERPVEDRPVVHHGPGRRARAPPE